MANGIQIINGFDLAANKPIDLRQVSVASEAERLAIKWVYNGLILKQLDNSKWYSCNVNAATNATSPYTNTSDWVELDFSGGNSAQILNGSTTPLNTLGNDGDLYIDTTTYDVYKKISGDWGSPIANIKGIKGDTGLTGATGSKGDKGDTGTGIQLKGSVATSTNLPTTASNGDSYVTADTGHLWVYNETTTTWVDCGQIKGDKGDTGATGTSGIVTVVDTESLNLTYVSGTQTLSGDVRVSTKTGNALSIVTDPGYYGLYSTSGDATLSAILTATTTLGGISSGTSYTIGTKLEQILRDLLTPYGNPTVSNLVITTSSSDSIYEVGQTVTVSLATFSTSNDSDGNGPINMYLSGTGFNKLVTTSPVSATSGTTLQKTTATSETWTLTAQNKNSIAITPATYSKSWQYRIFFGANSTIVTNQSTAQTVISTLQQTKLSSNKSTSYTCTSDNNDNTKYSYIAYPSSFGAISAIIQNGALPVITAWDLVGTYSYTNSYSISTNYYIYKSTVPGAYASGTTLAIS